MKKDIIMYILYLGIPVLLAILILIAKIQYWNTPLAECPLWVVWLLK